MRKVQTVIQKILLVVYEYIIDPVVLVFGLFIIFPHLQTVYNATVREYGINISKLISAFWEDMMMYPLPYVIFGVIILIWFALKRYKVKSEKESRDKMQESQNEIIKLLKQIRDKNTKRL